MLRGVSKRNFPWHTAGDTVPETDTWTRYRFFIAINSITTKFMRADPVRQS